MVTTKGLFTSLLGLTDHAFFQYLSLHYLPQDNSWEYKYDLTFVIPFAYILAFIIVLGVRHLLLMRIDWKKNGLATALLLVIMPIGMFYAINTVGKPLLISEQRKVETIYVPDSDRIYGDVQRVIYEPIKHYAGYYQNSDKISYELIFPSTKRSTEQSCGSSGIKSTKSGHPYVETLEKAYKSNSSDRGPQGEFTRYTYCFVIGSWKYTFLRDDGFDGPAYLNEYPTDKVIDTIYNGAPIVLGCNLNLDIYRIRNSHLDGDYCNYELVKQANDITQVAEDKFVIVCEEGRYVGASLESRCGQISTNGQESTASQEVTYSEVGNVVIDEWRVSIPLTEETKDMYYIKGSTSDFMFIGLKKYDSSDCFADETIKFVGTLSRRSKASNQAWQEQNPNGTPFEGLDLGDGYLYRLSVVGENRQADCNIPDTLEDVFDWMQARMKKQ